MGIKTSSLRLFFGIEIQAPWPENLPSGRIIKAEYRHLTLAFLGNLTPEKTKILLNSDFPKPKDLNFIVGQSGYFDVCHFLRLRHPRVAAWHACWHGSAIVNDFQRLLNTWLVQNDYTVDEREWNPHVTLCLQPFEFQAWKKAFEKIPFYTQTFHLYESMGELTYKPLLSFSFISPFEEMSHTADMAYLIRGKNTVELYYNSVTALAFKAPELLNFLNTKAKIDNIESIIENLNDAVSQMDIEVGCPFKAVSYHGEIKQKSPSILEWEMIIDV